MLHGGEMDVFIVTRAMTVGNDAHWGKARPLWLCNTLWFCRAQPLSLDLEDTVCMTS